MATEVWKFTLQPHSIVRMPKDAEILEAAEQSGNICIWARVNPQNPEVNREFRIFGTGHAISDELNLKYIGQAQLNRGFFVFHVFEVL